MPTQSIIPTTYAALRNRVREVLILGQQRIEQEKVRTYWEAGWYMDQHILLNQGRADYGKRVILKLSDELELNDSVLHRCVRFAQKFPRLFPGPILASRPKSGPLPRQIDKNGPSTPLTWSHYRTLLTVGDNRRRFQLLDLATRHGWTLEELEARIRASRQKEIPRQEDEGARKAAGALFKPKRGLLRTYRLIHIEHLGLQGEHKREDLPLFVDLGFSIFIPVSEQQRGKFEEGDIIQVESDSEWVKLPKATEDDLYTYPASMAKVHDLDTHWLVIELRCGERLTVARQKVRLRGVDGPELHTKAGRAAKRFVEEQIKKASEIVITTTKPDKFDRYLTDLWLDGRNVNQLVLERGLARPYSEVRPNDWNNLNWGRF